MSATQPEQRALESVQNTIKEVQEGNLPSNDEIKESLCEVQGTISENKDTLSKQGQKVAKDAEQILETTKELVDKKNDGDLLQESYRHANKATDKETLAERRKKLKEILLSMANNDEKQNEAAGAADHITRILRLLITSKEFRNLINDLETIFEEAFVVDDSETKSEQSDTPSQDLFRDPAITGNTMGTSSFGNTRTYYFGATASTIGQNDPNATTFGMHANESGAQGHLGDISFGNANQSKSKEEASDEVEDKLVEYWARIAHTLNENPEYRESINYLFDSINDLSKYLSKKADKMQDIHEKEEEKSQNKEADEHARAAWQNAKSFIENWISSDYSLDDFLDSVNDLATKAKNDDELEKYFKDLSEFFKKSVADKDYVQNEEKVKSDARERIQRGRRLFQGKYKKEFEKLQKELEYLNDGIQNDEGINQLQEDFKNLVRDLFTDESGEATIHTELLQDLQQIVPSLVKKLRRLPLPDVDLCDEESDLRIRNAVLDCGDIAPSYFRFTVRGDTEGDNVRNTITIIVSKIRARILGADFYYNKKTFPKITESGKADLAIYGKTGMTIALEICPFEDKDGFSLTKNLCNINKLNLRLRNTDHDVLYGMMSPFINSFVKNKIERVIQEKMQEIVEQGSVEAKEAVGRAVESAQDTAQQGMKQVQQTIEEKTD